MIKDSRINSTLAHYHIDMTANKLNTTIIKQRIVRIIQQQLMKQEKMRE